MDGPRMQVWTATERQLARALERARVRFSPHARVGVYEVDFVIEPYVAVEVDGYMHCLHGLAAKDKSKTAALEALGWRVLRFTGDEVRYAAGDCIKQVQRAVAEQRLRCVAGRPPEQLASWQCTLKSLLS